MHVKGESGAYLRAMIRLSIAPVDELAVLIRSKGKLLGGVCEEYDRRELE